MKKILFTLLVSLLSVGTYSQSVADLERDPSFKGITIGAPISKYSDILSFSHTKTYPADASGACVFNANELLSWYSSLRAKYGNNSFSLDDMSGTPSVCGMRWKANSVVLDIVYLFYGTFGDEKPKLQYYLYQREDDY